MKGSEVSYFCAVSLEEWESVTIFLSACNAFYQLFKSWVLHISRALCNNVLWYFIVFGMRAKFTKFYLALFLWGNIHFTVNIITFLNDLYFIWQKLLKKKNVYFPGSFFVTHNVFHNKITCFLHQKMKPLNKKILYLAIIVASIQWQMS